MAGPWNNAPLASCSQLRGAVVPAVCSVLSLVSLVVDWKSSCARELLAGETLLILGKQFSSLGSGLEMP